MADVLSTPDNLKARFSQFDSIANVTQRLQERIERINEANKEAAGEKDKTAQAYHKQVDKPTQDITDLVGKIAELFGVTGTRGEEASDYLDHGVKEAAEHGQTWNVDDAEKK
ncbi:hypothetical protein GCM10022223_45140 [Kineosporia mesophila]|uniref:Uncharacterized protein n=1 Tax=Kineosporia mesophila TaxID=566012 RepID=A0ABP6ZZR4_9ACTN|nr:hypothetical protein [Kineosporia mesophila]MCD5348935.1 hypothetical protein [Kineosporia mesophila]